MPSRRWWRVGADLETLRGRLKTRNYHSAQLYKARTHIVEMTACLRPELAELPAYVESKTVANAIKLGSNETVHGPLPSVRAAIEQAISTVNRYPDNHNLELKWRLAQHLDCGGGVGFVPEHIAVGAGSASLCQQLIHATASVGDEVLFGWRSFQIYPLLARVAGAIPIQVPLHDETFDLDAMLTAVTDRTRLILVCNPNNPTSTVVDPQTLACFVEAVPSRIVIAIDEAYVEYIRDAMQPDTLGLIRSHRNIVVLRTFSKAYGLAGLRIGYAVGDPKVITALNKVTVPYTTTNISQAAAIASLEATDELLARTDAVVAERVRVTDTLRGAGFTLPPSQANFVWLPLGAQTQDFADKAADAHIVVRPCGTDGVRITIGAPEENDALLQFAQDWRAATMRAGEQPAGAGPHTQGERPTRIRGYTAQLN